MTGYSRSWIYELVRSYNRIGVAALGDLRRQNRGAAPLLNDVQKPILKPSRTPLKEVLEGRRG